MKKIKIGIIGANPDRGWAQRAHLPALKALPEFELWAVCTTRQETAEASAKKFGAVQAYDSAEKLVADPDIDAVAVVVRVDKHFEPVMAALRARKHVLCEWPLGHSTAEAEKMAELAHAQNVVHQVGLQTRANVCLQELRRLVQSGFVGQLRSVTLTSTLTRWGAEISKEMQYGADARVGVNVVNIQGGHSLDAMCFCCGEFSELSATVANLRKQTRVVETGEIIPFSSPDQMIVNGILENGALAVAHFQSGALHNSGFKMIVRGTDGELVLASDDVVPTGSLSLMGIRRGETAMKRMEGAPLGNDAEISSLPQVTASIAASYRSFAVAVSAGRPSSPNFHDAVTRHRLLDVIHESSATGRRLHV